MHFLGYAYTKCVGGVESFCTIFPFMRSILNKRCQLLFTDVCVPQNSYVEALFTKIMLFGCGTFGRQLSHESGALVNDINALKRRDERERVDLTFLAMWRYCKKAAICKQERGLSSDIESIRTLILDFPAFKIVRNGRCLSQPSWCYLL